MRYMPPRQTTWSKTVVNGVVVENQKVWCLNPVVIQLLCTLDFNVLTATRLKSLVLHELVTLQKHHQRTK